MRTMHQLRDLGVSLALDDFGTGHSSLAHLRAFPIDVLKIAQPFVEGLEADGRETAFVETIVRLADSLGLDVVAEGVETRQQAEIAAASTASTGRATTSDARSRRSASRRTSRRRGCPAARRATSRPDVRRGVETSRLAQRTRVSSANALSSSSAIA